MYSLCPLKYYLIHMKLQRSYVNTKCSQQWPSSNHTELQHTPTSHIICSIFNEIFLNYSDKSLIIPIHDFSSRSTCSRQVFTTSDATVDFVTLCRCDLLHLCLIIRRVSHSTGWHRGVAVECRIHDREVAGSSLGRALRCKNSGQVSHTCVPLSPSIITWYWPEGGDA